MASLLPLNGHMSSYFDTIHLKLSTHAYFALLFHSMLSDYENSKNKFYDVITSVLNRREFSSCEVSDLPCSVSFIAVVSSGAVTAVCRHRTLKLVGTLETVGTFNNLISFHISVCRSNSGS